MSSGGPVDDHDTLSVEIAGSDGVSEAALIWRVPPAARRVVLDAAWPAELTASAQAGGWWLGVLAGVETVKRLPVAVRALDEDGRTVAVDEGLVENVRIPLRYRMRLWLRPPPRGPVTYPTSRRRLFGRLRHRP